MIHKILLCAGIVVFSFLKSFSQDYAIVYDSITKTFKVNRDDTYAIGKKVADFESISLNGDPISNDNLFGKVTLVNLWFEGCSPCIAELDALINLHNKYKSNTAFQFLSCTIDNVEIAQKAVNKYNIPFIVYPISRELAYKMNFNMGFPTNMVINKDGKIVYFKTGGPLEKERAEKQIAEMDEVIAQLLNK